MSKAEERACQYTGYCKSQSYSDFLKGYRQAEKDLKLTWEDIKVIEKLLGFETIIESPKEFYQKVLKRFKESKARKRVMRNTR